MTPFLALSRALEQLPMPAREERPETLIPPVGPAPVANCFESRAQRVFETAVSAVQAQLNHLSKEEIYSPPHGWFDAMFARQIAVHLMIKRFDVPSLLAAAELERSRQGILRAVRVVNERLYWPDFAHVYETMARDAEAHWRETEGHTHV